MRSLTAKQKKLLKEYIRKNPDCRTVEDMDSETYHAIDEINPCEIFYQNVNNFLYESR